MKKLLIILCVFYSAVCSAQVKGGDASKYIKHKPDTSAKWFSVESNYSPRSSAAADSGWLDGLKLQSKQACVDLMINGKLTRPVHCILRNDTLYMILDSIFYPLFKESKIIEVDGMRFELKPIARKYPDSLPYKWMMDTNQLK